MRALSAARYPLALAALAASAAAHADHPAVDFGPGSSGPITTISATTLPKGAAAFGVRPQYAKPERLSDEELQSRAGRHIHAHSSDYLFSPSMAAGYGVNDDFTLVFNLPHVRRSNIRAGEHGHGAGGAAVRTGTGKANGSKQSIRPARIPGIRCSAPL